MKLNRDSLATIINSPKDDSGKVNAYHMLASMTAGTDATEAIRYTKKGIALGKQLGYDKGVASCMLNTSYCYGLLNKLPEALYYIDSTILWYKKMGKTDRLAFCYKSRAEYKQKLGQIRQSLNDCDTAIYYAEKNGNPNFKRYVYKLMADSYFSQTDYKESGEYYSKAYDLTVAIKDSLPMADLLSCLGRVYEKRNEFEKSISHFQNAANIAIAIKERNNVSEYYNSLSKVFLAKGDNKAAEQAALKAVDFAKAGKNKMHLAAAQETLGSIYIKNDSTTAALNVAAESFNTALSIKATDIQQNSADLLAEAYLKKGDYKNAYYYLRISKTLNDSLADEKYSKDVTDVLARFKVSEKDNEILLLNKDKELQNQKLQKQRLLMAAAAVLALLSLAGLWLLLNRNKLRQRMKELELRNRIAADLHDEVGSSLSSINMLSQMATRPGNETMQKDILERMSTNAKETMEKMSDLVWTIKPEEAEGSNLKQRMERFAYEICGSKNITLSLELDKLETKDLTMEQRKNMYLIFKEAVNNAVKYSDTEKIAISAANGNNVLTMIVKDEGKGFDLGTVIKGNGLENIQMRAASVGGKLIIDSVPGSGTLVKLTMPLTL